MVRIMHAHWQVMDQPLLLAGAPFIAALYLFQLTTNQVMPMELLDER